MSVDKLVATYGYYSWKLKITVDGSPDTVATGVIKVDE